jgi:hypothetical protein
MNGIKLRSVVMGRRDNMAYQIKSTLSGQTHTLIVSTATEALAELAHMPVRGHQDVTVRDLRGNAIDPRDLKTQSVREWQDRSKDA